MADNTKVYVVIVSEQTRDKEAKIEIYGTNQVINIESLVEELAAQVNTDEYILIEDQSTYKKFVDCYNENCVIIYYEEVVVRN